LLQFAKNRTCFAEKSIISSQGFKIILFILPFSKEFANIELCNSERMPIYYQLEKMSRRRITVAITLIMVLSLVYSCRNAGQDTIGRSDASAKKTIQQDDGTISLKMEKASYYKDREDPKGNTAEWSFVVSKPGRYSVWLSSVTLDTMNLQYSGNVVISLLDERLEVKPVGNKIVTNANGVKYPYFRADSYMGSFYIQEAGEYYLQVMSDKAVPQQETTPAGQELSHTKLVSVILSPLTR
jgi:hypothetical protein